MFAGANDENNAMIGCHRGCQEDLFGHLDS